MVTSREACPLMGSTSCVPAQPFTAAAKAATPPEKEAGSAVGPVDLAVPEVSCGMTVLLSNTIFRGRFLVAGRNEDVVDPCA
jgi:hypothetical protein